jgi:single-stranded-DNA-specific exonuclease
MRWLIREVDTVSAHRLSETLGVSPLLGRLLAERGLADPDEATRFLHPRLSHLHDPFEMLGMEAAVRRIVQAVERKEKILIYGDYDVDGSLAVVILRMALSLIGAEVHHHIPHRIRDGYGMQEEVIEQAGQQGFSLIISVDTGIRAFAVIERAAELGVDCIITDHHLPGGDWSPGHASQDGRDACLHVPHALAVLNPKQANCSYPDKNLCGAGVAFKLVQALLQTHPALSRRSARLLPSFLKLVSIGTIADSVPLVGENRVIARLGLEGLRQPVNHGLRALLEVAGLDGKNVTAGDVGFRLAPRLNAAGRMESAQDVIELLTTSDAAGAQQLAVKLNRLNSERQKAEQDILAEIEERYRRQPESFSDSCLVLEGEGWHRGVIGIVASRIMDRFHRPTLVIACQDGAGHGSGRSFENFPLLDALTACGDLFDRFGGHAFAAGFALPVERIAELRRRLNQFAAQRLGPNDLEGKVAIDAEVSFSDLSEALVEELDHLAPYGYGNPRPVFASRDARVSGRPRLLQEKHVKMQVAQRGRVLDAIGWRKSAWMEQLGNPAATLDLAFTLDLNHYQNQTTLQLELLDIITPSEV